MATPPLPDAAHIERYKAVVDAVKKGEAVFDGAPNVYILVGAKFGKRPETISKSYRYCIQRWPAECPDIRALARAGKLNAPPVMPAPTAPASESAPESLSEFDYPEEGTEDLDARLTSVQRSIKKLEKASLESIAQASNCSQGEALDAILELREKGIAIAQSGEMYWLQDVQTPAFAERGPEHDYISRDDNTFLFGAFGDKHYGSKYCREDIIEEMYDRFVDEGVDRVFDTGNWIDGESRFNKGDLLPEAHGLEPQIQLLADRHPQREGIKTYAVWGDDHEGWYAQKFQADMGRLAQDAFRARGRVDWIDLGFMEAHVRLVNKNTGESSMLAVVHPGGGSAYAVSYSIQKIVEAMEGGEKPAVALYGHYHKLWAGNIRNVWVCQTGTGKDQDTYMRKKRIAAHVGGCIIKLHQDPETGAITRFQPEMIRFFNKGFYNRRWSHHGPVEHPEREAGYVHQTHAGEEAADE